MKKPKEPKPNSLLFSGLKILYFLPIFKGNNEKENLKIDFSITLQSSDLKASIKFGELTAIAPAVQFADFQHLICSY